MEVARRRATDVARCTRASADHGCRSRGSAQEEPRITRAHEMRAHDGKRKREGAEVLWHQEDGMTGETRLPPSSCDRRGNRGVAVCRISAAAAVAVSLASPVQHLTASCWIIAGRHAGNSLPRHLLLLISRDTQDAELTRQRSGRRERESERRG